MIKHLILYFIRSKTLKLLKLVGLIWFLFRLFKRTFQILTGNINTYSEVENILQPIIIASKVRIYPYSQYDRTVCLRVELVGCPWTGKHFIFGYTFVLQKKEKNSCRNILNRLKTLLINFNEFQRDENKHSITNVNFLIWC